MPFEIPENWEWATLELVCSKIGSGSTPRGSNYATSGIPFFRSQNVYDDGLVYDDIKFISEEIHQQMKSTEVQPNDILLNITGGSLGRCAVVPSDFERGNVSQHVCILRPILLETQFLHCFILSGYFSQTMKVTGSGREGLPKYNLGKMAIPIPPLNEQTHIVAEINRWFSLISDLKRNESELNETVKVTKAKVLDLAIHGKLVPQDPNDEPAIELLKRVNPNAAICDTSHYGNLPTNWSISTMSDLCRIIDGEKQSNINRIYLDVKYLRGKSDGEYLMSGKFVPANSTMILVDGENSGEIFTTTIDGYQGSTFKILDISKEMYKPFVLYIIMSYQKQLRENKVGSAIPHLNKKLFREIVVGVPPYEEQKRIVAGIDKLFSYLNTISADL